MVNTYIIEKVSLSDERKIQITQIVGAQRTIQILINNSSDRDETNRSIIQLDRESKYLGNENPYLLTLWGATYFSGGIDSLQIADSIIEYGHKNPGKSLDVVMGGLSELVKEAYLGSKHAINLLNIVLENSNYETISSCSPDAFSKLSDICQNKEEEDFTKEEEDLIKTAEFINRLIKEESPEKATSIATKAFRIFRRNPYLETLWNIHTQFQEHELTILTKSMITCSRNEGIGIDEIIGSIRKYIDLISNGDTNAKTGLYTIISSSRYDLLEKFLEIMEKVDGDSSLKKPLSVTQLRSYILNNKFYPSTEDANAEFIGINLPTVEELSDYYKNPDKARRRIVQIAIMLSRARLLSDTFETHHERRFWRTMVERSSDGRNTRPFIRAYKRGNFSTNNEIQTLQGLIQLVTRNVTEDFEEVKIRSALLKDIVDRIRGIKKSDETYLENLTREQRKEIFKKTRQAYRINLLMLIDPSLISGSTEEAKAWQKEFQKFLNDNA